MNRLTRRINYWLRYLAGLFDPARERMPRSAGRPIDVVINAVPKDLPTLPLCVQGVRTMVNDPITAIYLVGPDTEALRSAARELECEFVDERSVLGYGPEAIDGAIMPDGTDRRGWIFQQLLKLSGRIGTEPEYLCIDADHVLVQPHTFIARDGRYVLYQSKECHEPYYECMERLLGLGPWRDGLSYVSHKMIFSRSELQRMGQRMKWVSSPSTPSTAPRVDTLIIQALDMTQGKSPFSEFELYGSWLPGSMKHTRLWKQKALRRRGPLPTYRQLLSRYSLLYRSVTFPDYLK